MPKDHRIASHAPNLPFSVQVACLVPVLLLASAAAAQSFIPVDQVRSVNGFVIVPQCLGDHADSSAAVGFEPFDATAHAQRACDSGAGVATASQQSMIGAFAMAGTGSSHSEAHGPVPNVIHAIGHSLFLVSFDLPRSIRFDLDGMLSAQASNDPILVLSGATIEMCGPGDEAILVHELLPNSDGSLKTLELDEVGIVEPGEYTLRAESATVIDNEVPPSRTAQSAFDFVLHLTILGDLDGNGAVDVDDLVQLLIAWGGCPSPPESCPGDVNLDGVVTVDDLLILLINWG